MVPPPNNSSLRWVQHIKYSSLSLRVILMISFSIFSGQLLCWSEVCILPGHTDQAVHWTSGLRCQPPPPRPHTTGDCQQNSEWTSWTWWVWNCLRKINLHLLWLLYVHISCVSLVWINCGTCEAVTRAQNVQYTSVYNLIPRLLPVSLYTKSGEETRSEASLVYDAHEVIAIVSLSLSLCVCVCVCVCDHSSTG